ncbi:hypothetical protein RBI22_15140 [Alcaligenaceae bacterium C4P045]|nr:hypothetical protein [Alcaligenaceae bacterium C4P045]
MTWSTLRPLLWPAMVLLAFWGYGQYQHAAGKEECREAQRVAQLEAFQASAEKLAGLSQLLDGAARTLANAQPKIIERYTRVEVQKPLPAGCVLDADRLRNINDAIDAANAARNSGR